MTPVTVAIAGLGVIGRQHLRLVQSSTDFAVVGVSDPAITDESPLTGGVPTFRDFTGMLDTTAPSAVIIAAPNQVHSDLALACLDRSIPVLIEKPVAANLEDAAKIVSAVASTGVPALVGHHRRHSPDMVAASRSLANGELGQLVSVSCIWMARKPDGYYSVPWRVSAGGGPIMINLIHEIDCLRFVVGEIESVYAVSANKARGLAVEDAAAVAVQFSNGAVGTLTISDSTPSPWMWDVASGQGADFPYQYGDCFYFGGTQASLALPSLRKYSNAPDGDWRRPLVSTTVESGRADCYDSQLVHFAAVVRGQTAPICSALDGYRTLAATLAVAQSAQTGRPVRVADMAGAVMP